MDDVSCDADSPPDSPPFRPPPSAAALADDDEGETLLGVRAAFPASFGRQEQRVTPLEAVHAQTARAHAERAGVKGKKKAAGMKFSIGPSLAKRLGDGAKAGLAGTAAVGAAAVGAAGAGGVVERGGAGGGAERVGGGAERAGGDEATGGSLRGATGGSLRGATGGSWREKGGAPCGSAGGAHGGAGGAGAVRDGGAADGRGAAVVQREGEGAGEGAGEGEGEGGGDAEGHAVIGPPRPPGRLEDGGGGRIGPPAPGAAGSRQQHGGRKKSRAAGQQDEQRSDGSEEEDEEEDAEAGEEEEDEFGVPLSNEIVLGGHTKAVAALAVDPTGTRVISGSYDYSLRFYDFHGMDSRLKAFRDLVPFDGHQVRAVSFSPSADLFITATGNAQAKVYDRDGRSKGEFVRGDMYIRDLRNTKGHIAGLTTAQWHPCERHTALTASDDGSLRIWDVRDFKSQKKVVKPKLARPGRVPVTAAEWGPDGRLVAAGLNDGSLQVWNVKAGWGSLPDLLCTDAHERGDDITGVSFCSDASLLVSRSMDGTMKVWDVRKFKQPVKVFPDLPNHYQQTNVAWSPDERLFFTGTSAEKGGRGGQLHFYSKESLDLVRVTGVSPDQSVVRVLWHARLNQIFATCGDKKAGGTHILYDPTLSERGALVCVARAPRAPRPEDLCARVAAPAIRNPHALPMFRDEPSRKRQREKARKDPVASQRPDLPMEGPGHGGRVGQTKGTLLTQYLLRPVVRDQFPFSSSPLPDPSPYPQPLPRFEPFPRVCVRAVHGQEGGLLKETWMEEDPREAILKYADAAAKDPQIIAPAYAATQPTTLFHESDDEDQD
ncbi:unnamed protein product [Closterium sp. Yama58-4]|nr:unnamed protein product [Closterium sp. Yama58-4]